MTKIAMPTSGQLAALNSAAHLRFAGAGPAKAATTAGTTNPLAAPVQSRTAIAGRAPTPTVRASPASLRAAVGNLRAMSITLSDPLLLETALGVQSMNQEASSKKTSAQSERLSRMNELKKKLEDEMKAFKAAHSSDILSKILIAVSALIAVASCGTMIAGAVVSSIAQGISLLTNGLTTMAGQGAAVTIGSSAATTTSVAASSAIPTLEAALAETSLGQVITGFKAAVFVLGVTDASVVAAKGGYDYEGKMADADALRHGKRIDSSRDALKEIVSELRENIEQQASRIEQTYAILDARHALDGAILRG